MSFQAGDLIVDHACPPESGAGIMLCVTDRLILESLECFLLPCQILRLHRNGLQCQHAIDRLASRDPREFALYRLSAWETLTPQEAGNLESFVREMLRSLPLRGISSAVAVGRILMRLGKFPRFNVKLLEGYSVSMLVAELVGTGVYEHIGVPHVEDAVSVAA